MEYYIIISTVNLSNTIFITLVEIIKELKNNLNKIQHNDNGVIIQ
jgi:hypothetical protein